MRGAIPPIPKFAFMAWCLIKHRDNFTLLYFTLLYFTFYYLVCLFSSIIMKHIASVWCHRDNLRHSQHRGFRRVVARFLCLIVPAGDILRPCLSARNVPLEAVDVNGFLLNVILIAVMEIISFHFRKPFNVGLREPVVMLLNRFTYRIQWGRFNVLLCSLGSEADNPPPSSSEVKNAWNYTSTLQYVFFI
jgi:hypothetical protein